MNSTTSEPAPVRRNAARLSGRTDRNECAAAAVGHRPPWRRAHRISWACSHIDSTRQHRRVAGAGATQSRIPPQPSATWPHCALSPAHVAGLPLLPRCRWPFNTDADAMVARPQVNTPLQPSRIQPQLASTASQATGTQPHRLAPVAPRLGRRAPAAIQSFRNRRQRRGWLLRRHVIGVQPR
jgi:hypothetical protein